MNSRMRVKTAFAHKEPDRVPIDYSANPGIDGRLKEYFKLDPSDSEGLLRCLNIDFRHVGAPYNGPKLHDVPDDRHVDLWGARSRWVEHASGGYWDFCDFPLADATLDDVLAFPLPSPEDFRYDVVPDACLNYGDYCLVAGGAGTPDIINSTGRVRTMEQVLVDLITEDPISYTYIDRKNEIELDVLEKTLEAGGGRIDIVQLGEDLGTQIGPMIGIELFRSAFRPRLQKFIDLAKRFDALVMIHCCGSSSWAFDDFIDMGIDIVDTLQPEAKDMDPVYLKKRYGDRLSFHGCISTAGPVAKGSVDDTRRDVRETLKAMMDGGGYAMSPTHQLQDDSPTENVVAMYEQTIESGTYR